MRIFTIFFCVLIFFVFQLNGSSVNNQAISRGHFVSEKDSLTVLNILQNKCNTCHQKKKKVIFTNNNLSSYYLLIEEQVFIKQKMPKGRDFTLTEIEKLVLSDWILSLKN